MEALKRGDPLWLGPYQLLGRLGSGDLGRVFFGQRVNGAQAAVKLVHDRYARDARFGARFAREVAAAQAVRAPWTAAVLDAEPQGPQPWLATVYVHGPTVDQAVDAGGPLPEPHVRVLAARMAEALAALHSAGVVHRAVTPNNVVLGGDGPILTDCGVAQDTDSDETKPSDVFSLAAVVLYAATGRGPFAGVTDVGADLALLPADLRDTLTPCFATKAADRPTAQALAAAFTARSPAPAPAPAPAPLASASAPAPAPSAPAPSPVPADIQDPDATAVVRPVDRSDDTTVVVRPVDRSNDSTAVVTPLSPPAGAAGKKRWRTIGGVAAVVVVVVLLGIGGLTGNGGLTGKNSVGELSAAIDAGVGPTPRAKVILSYRSSGKFAYASEGAGEFRIDAEGRSATSTVRSASGETDMTTVLVPGRVFLKGMSTGSVTPPPDKPWVEVPLDSTGPMAHYTKSLPLQIDFWTNPAKGLLKQGDAVTVADSADDEVDGVPARRYVLRTDYAKAAELATDSAEKQRYLTSLDSGQKERILTLWLDERDRPLRTRTEFQLGPKDSGTIVIDNRWRGWGEPVDIQPPPADQVTPG